MGRFKIITNDFERVEPGVGANPKQVGQTGVRCVSPPGHWLQISSAILPVFRLMCVRSSSETTSIAC